MRVPIGEFGKRKPAHIQQREPSFADIGILGFVERAAIEPRRSITDSRQTSRVSRLQTSRRRLNFTAPVQSWGPFSFDRLPEQANTYHGGFCKIPVVSDFGLVLIWSASSNTTHKIMTRHLHSMTITRSQFRESLRSSLAPASQPL